MIHKKLMILKADLEQQIRIRTEEILNNPKFTPDKEGFLWKSGYLSAMKNIDKEIETILKGDAE